MTRERRVALGCLMVLVLAAAVGAGGDPGIPLYEAARARYRALDADGPEARNPESWRAAARRFRRVADEAPRSAKADDALYMVGICRERAAALSAGPADRRAAVEAYDRLARAYRDSRLADDALFRAGRILEGAGDRAGARRFYERVLRDTPSGDMVGAARRRLRDLDRPTAVAGVRRWSGPRYTRVVVDLGHTVAYQVGELPADPNAKRPPRIFVDLRPARVGRGCERCVAVGDGLVRRVRVAQHDPDTVRVVLDLEEPADHRVFPLEGPARLVIDAFSSRSASEDVVARVLREGAAGRRPFRVVIDPGHGGKDPGALGPGGLKEKDVTLAIARELASLLREREGWEVRLTRDRDVYLSLEERTARANAFGADLFLSIHANASPSRRARGIETYYLSPSSDRAARRLAALENRGREEDLAEMEHILADVVLSAKVEDSRRLARAVQEALVDELARSVGPVRDLGVKQGPFYVLTGAVMPAVLVETSFITHPEESRRLRDPAFRKRVAQALAKGVEAFARGRGG
ncbi:MAG: N-acetylmuramoyl-L-alanine amidase [Candidatus Dadabacteria bacterium]|nr:MAG: N-acetylmuramoyl-L-alanine amidase [Candidatus Dadabacteria bacterium]